MGPPRADPVVLDPAACSPPVRDISPRRKASVPDVDAVSLAETPGLPAGLFVRAERRHTFPR